MAGVARQKTPLEKAGAAAREAYSKAKEAHDKNSNATTKNAMDVAKTKANDATRAENRERFETIGAARVANVIVKLQAVAKTGNKRSYEYSEADIAKIESAITGELALTVTTMRDNLKAGPKAAAAKSSFKF